MARTTVTTAAAAGAVPARAPVAADTWQDILLQGTIAGLAGAAVSALVVFVGDLLVGQPAFHTAALLGSSVFYGLTDPEALTVWAGPVFAYNGLHLMVFLAFGVLAAWLAARAVRGPDFWYIGLTAFIFVGAHLLALVLTITQTVRAAASWALLGTATALASAALIAVIWRMQPALGRAMEHSEDFDVST